MKDVQPTVDAKLNPDIVILRNDLILPDAGNNNATSLDNSQPMFIENNNVDLIHFNNPSDEKLNLILENQNKIMAHLSKLQTSFDFIADILTKNTVSAITTNQTSTLTQKNIIEPINSHENLKQFEDKLKCQKYFNDVVNSMTHICGNKGKEKGIDCCYRLIDYFITRDLLNECSWTGNSKKTDKEKIPLKFFECFRKCFYEIILCADKDFSLSECDIFFKRILKNSLQRLSSKSSILSKHKNRPKSLVYKKSIEKSAEINEGNTSQETELNEEQEQVVGTDESSVEGDVSDNDK